jgi:pilus assembly protein HofN
MLRLRALQTELTGMQSVQHALASGRNCPHRRSAGTSTTRMATGAGIPFPRHPSQVWLTELRYQPPALMLTGYAITLPALCSARCAGQIAGFTPGTAGELRQDSQGRWMFTLHLKSEG